MFSYRVAGILLRDGNILLQKSADDTGFAVPGGHVELSETNAQTLIREFREEIGADVTVGDLKWVGEIFFTWGNRPCHQICLYYEVVLQDESQIPHESFWAPDEHVDEREIKIKFHWMPIDDLDKIEVHPGNIADLIKRYKDGVQHFIYREYA